MIIKSLFFNIIDANSIKEAKKIKNKLFLLSSNVPQVIHKLTSKLIIPEFKKTHKSPHRLKNSNNIK